MVVKKTELLGPTKTIRVGKAVKAKLRDLMKPGETYGTCLHRILIEEELERARG